MRTIPNEQKLWMMEQMAEIAEKDNPLLSDAIRYSVINMRSMLKEIERQKLRGDTYRARALALVKQCRDWRSAANEELRAGNAIDYELAEREEEVARLRGALQTARRFIKNGIELGYIHMPDPETPDPAHDTLPMIEEALKGTKI